MLERMFNRLNKLKRKGKDSPMAYNLLDALSAFSRGSLSLFGRPFYLRERMELMNPFFLCVGLRMAFSVWRPASARICNGKG